MFRRFNRLVPIFNSKQDTLSSYGEYVICFLIKRIMNLKIPPKEKWENRDFKIKDKKK